MSRAFLRQHQALQCLGTGLGCSVLLRSIASTHGLPPHADEASLYVHWPYCLKRCSYCNFNKYIHRGQNAVMTECLQKETKTLLQLSQVSRISSVFFGGGTPSLAQPSTIAAVLEAVSKNVHLSDDAEVTLEVNPTPAGKASLKDFMLAGVNRFSVGIQSLNDDHLRTLGRDHNSQHALRTVSEARTLCPGRVSVDIMFALPGQSVKSWESELEKLLPNAVSEHNVGYWRGHQYIGVGPGAHGRFVPRAVGGVQREARTQTLEPDVWIREVQRHGHGTRRQIQLDHRGLLEEVLVMGLRMNEGITRQHWELFSPEADLQHIFGMSENVQELQAGGLLMLDDRGLRCSWEGLALLDSILPTMLLELETFFQSRVSAHQQEHRLSQRRMTVYIGET